MAAEGPAVSSKCPLAQASASLMAPGHGNVGQSLSLMGNIHQISPGLDKRVQAQATWAALGKSRQQGAGGRMGRGLWTAP